MTYSLDYPTAASLKAEARALRAERQAEGQPLSHGAALEAVARSHGFKDWNTARAAFPDRNVSPVQVGDRVQGTYLKQRFVGTVLGVAARETQQGLFSVTVLFDEPVDVITFESFSAFRHRVTTTIDPYGVSPARTSDGEPHMRIARL